MSHWKSALLGAALAICALALPATAQTTLRAGHISPNDSIEGRAILRFADLVKQKTNGTLVIEVFPSEQLGSATTEAESTMIGNQDMYFGGSPEFERFSDGLKLIGLNWVIPSEAAFRKITKDPVWNDLLINPLNKVGLVVLSSNWERGPYRVMVSTKPIAGIADMKGLRFRIAPIDTWRRAWGAVGMQTVVLAWNDVYLGMKQGTIDAVTSPISLVAPMNFTDVAKYIVRTDEFWQILVPTINKARMESLAPDQQRALYAAADEVGSWFVAEQDRLADQDIARMEKEKGAHFAVLDLKPGVALMKPVVLSMESEGFVPSGLYDRIQAIANQP